MNQGSARFEARQTLCFGGSAVGTAFQMRQSCLMNLGQGVVLIALARAHRAGAAGLATADLIAYLFLACSLMTFLWFPAVWVRDRKGGRLWPS